MIVLLAGFFIFQALSKPEEPREVDHKTKQERLTKISKHTATDSDYNARIDSVHSENNSSMQKIMTNELTNTKESEYNFRTTD